MGTFVTGTSVDGTAIFPDGDKAAAPGVRAAPGWSTDNYLKATEANAIRDALLDLRADARAHVVNVKHYGATGDGSTDDSTAVQAAIDVAEAAGGGIVSFPPGTYLLTAAGLTVQAAGVTLRGEGGATIRASTAAAFEHCINASSANGLRLVGLTVDAKGLERKAVLPQRAMPVIITSSEDVSVVDCVFKGALGDPLSTLPGVNLGLSAVTRAKIIGCTLIGNDEAGNESDGIYAKGTQIVISGCVAKSCLDTAFVLESCNYSGIVGCTSDGCAVGAAITIDGASTYEGNYIDGLTVNDWNAATGGVAIGIVGTSIAGTLKNTRVSGLTMDVKSAATGQALYLKNLSTSGGVVQRVVFEGLLLDGAESHCLDMGSTGGGTITDVLVSASKFRKYDTNGSCIVVRDNVSDVVIYGCTTLGGQYGILFADPDEVTVVGCYIDGNSQATHGVYWSGTEAAAGAARAFDSPVYRVTTARYGADAGVTPLVVTPDTSRTESGLVFGHQHDTALYRSAANTLATPDSLHVSRALVQKLTAANVADAGTGSVDASAGSIFVFNAQGATMTVAAPTGGTEGQRITVRIRNNSGGATAVTWSSAYRMAAWTDPANGFSRAVVFEFNGTNWEEAGRTTADVANP